MDSNLYFPSVEKFRNALSKATVFKTDDEDNRVMVIDLNRVTEVDHTSLKVIQEDYVKGKKKSDFNSKMNLIDFLDAKSDAVYMGKERRKMLFFQR